MSLSDSRYIAWWARCTGWGRIFTIGIVSVCILGACDSTGPAMTTTPTTSVQTPLLQSTNVIHVLPVAGLERPLQLVLADAIAASLRDSERPAVLAGTVNNQGPSIIGKVTKVKPHGSVVWISTNWGLSAPYGTIVAERRREIVIDKALWDRGSVEIVNLIVGDAMPAVAAMVHDHVGPLHVAQSVIMEKSPTEPARIKTQPIAQKLAPIPNAATSQEAAPSLENEIPDLLPKGEIKADEGSPGIPAKSTTTKEKAPMPASRPPRVLAPRAASNPAATAGRTSEELATKPASEPSASPDDAVSPPNQIPNRLESPKSSSGIASSPGDTPVVWGRPSFLIRPVEGAPGDGNKSLNVALGAALRGKDLTVTEDPRQAGYEIVGKVDVGPAVNGRQRARIAWVVNTIAGEEVGKAVQENVIAAGSLDRSWGRVAVIVSSAAAEGIQQLFEAPRPKLTPVGAVPEFPNIPALPRVPGRALPPPPS